MTAHPELGTRLLLPSLAHCRGIRAPWYVVADPAALRSGERVADTAAIAPNLGCLSYVLVSAGSTAAGALIGLPLGGSASAGFALLGLVVGLAAVVAHTQLETGRRRRRAAGSVLVVEPEDGDSWSFCEVVGQLVASRAWTGGLVDRDRVVPLILWRVVSTYRALAPVEADIAAAREHPGLADVVARRTAEIAAVREALDAVRHRVRAIADSARELDARDRAHRDEATRRDAEAALRERLTGTATPAPQELADVDDQAERIQVSAAVLDELLTETDRITGMVPEPPPA